MTSTNEPRTGPAAHPATAFEAIMQSLDRAQLSRRKLLVGTAAAGAAVVAGAAIGPMSADAQDTTEIVFTYWGSPQEQDAVASMCDSFNEQNPTISVRAQYVPNDGYTEKITTMLASNDLPDVAYMDAAQAWDITVGGATLDLAPFVAADAESGTLVPNTNYVYDGGKVMSTSLAIGIILTYYNRKLFDDAGIPVPSSKAADAMAWPAFVDLAKSLTKDRSGRDAHDPEFDPESIDVYGATFQQFLEGYMPFILSNGGNFASADGTQLLLNQPEAVEALQNLQDLIYVHHVAPTPAQSSALPATDVLMQTGKIAMDLNGMWKVLDYSQHENLEWGVAPLPYFKEPVTVRFGIPIVVSAQTANPAATYEFYRWRYSPDRIDLYRRGLWMPIAQDSYTDQTKIAAWIDAEEGVYPENARDVFIDYALNNAPYQTPGYWLKNLNQILLEAVTPALDLIWTGEATAQAAMDQAVATATPLMQGVYQPPAQTATPLAAVE